MSAKIQAAVERLNDILPLHPRQKTLSPELTRLYLAVLESFVTQGRSLTKSEMAAQVEDIDAAIDILRQNDMVVFDQQDNPVGAYPFTMESRKHKIEINGHTVHAMCALDALSISPMFNIQTRIESSCEASGHTVTIEQSGHTVLNPDECHAVHFGINWNSAASGGCTTSCCADSLCTEMIFLIDQATATNWLNEDPENREIFNLEDAISFGAGFFVPLVNG